MKTLRTLIGLVFALLLLLQAARAEDCVDLQQVSDETRPAFCPGGYAASGVQCQGRYCDDVILTCCRYTAKSSTHADPHNWSNWYSEERGGYPSPAKTYQFIAGVECSGDYCDNLRVDRHTPGLTVGTDCSTLERISEETHGTQCPANQFISELRCTGSYCDNLTTECCRPAEEPGADCKVAQTAQGAEIPVVRGLVGPQKGGTASYCDSGYAARGIDCFGDYCGAMQTTCCRYNAQVPPSETHQDSRWFSEEGPNNSQETATGFVSGVLCGGDHCDNLALREVFSPQLENTGVCRWLPYFSEEPHPREYAMCSDDEFVVGAACRGSYCDDVSLKCCKFNRKRPTFERIHP
jgi:hypothetical protein